MGNNWLRENFTRLREVHAQFAPSIRLKAQVATQKGQFAPLAQGALFGRYALHTILNSAVTASVRVAAPNSAYAPNMVGGSTP